MPAILADQFEIDFETAVWPTKEMIEHAAEEMSEERLCIWWAGGQGPFQGEWWSQLKSYERKQWRDRYAWEKSQAISRGRPIASACRVYAAEQVEVDHLVKTYRPMIEDWAAEIRRCFSKGIPCTIKAEPAFQWMLDAAFLEACVPKACLSQPAPANE